MKVAIYNDTSSSAHFGCQLVMAAYRELLEKRDIEIIASMPRYQKDTVYPVSWRSDESKRILDKADLVIVNGEGNIHHHKNTRMLKIAEVYPCILTNCVFQDISSFKSHLLQNFKHITVRESMSADYMMREHGYKPEVVPDLIFSHTIPRLPECKRDGTFFSDRAIGFITCQDDKGCYYTLPPDEPRFVEKMSAYKRACCGRFHAICIAAMLDMPFSAWASNTWKNEAIMADMGVPELYTDRQRASLDLIPDVCPESVASYVSNAKARINALFDRIYEL